MSNDPTTRTGLSPQRRAARQRSAMTKQTLKGLTPVSINFLLTCSETSLVNYELARLAECANLRSELEEIQNLLTDATAQAALVAWFRSQDRQTLKHAIENEESPLEWAQRMISQGQRSEEELIPRASLEPGAAHLAGALRYAERNIAEGKCSVCPKPQDRNSVRYCTKHLAMVRDRKRQEKGLRSDPGSREYLYSGELTPSTHGRAPGNFARLAMNRDKKTRALLAELGLPFDSAAVSLEASVEALVKCMPHSKNDAMTQAELFEKACIPSKITGGKALLQLLSAGQVQRIGKGARDNPFRYFSTVGLDKHVG